MDATRNPAFTLTPAGHISQIRVSRSETEAAGGIGKRQQYGKRATLPHRSPIIAQKLRLTRRLAF